MKSIKEFLKYNKKGIFIGLGIFTIIGVALVLFLVFASNDKKEQEETLKDKLNGYLSELGKSFYEDYYYDAVASKNEDVSIVFENVLNFFKHKREIFSFLFVIL